jgi:hypothetical protein
VKANRVASLYRGGLRVVLGYAPVLGSLALAPGCGTDDVIVATLPAEVEADAGAGADSGCSTNDDCQPAEFCARTSCNEAYGTCEVRPLLCDDQQGPSCGCDGVSYWNDCLRMQYGATASQSGSCSTGAASCMDQNALDCPVIGAACAKLLPPGVACPPDTLGACWVLPVECPQMDLPDRWNACDDRMDCEDTCQAIRSGQPHRHDVTRQCMQGPTGP